MKRASLLVLLSVLVLLPAAQTGRANATTPQRKPKWALYFYCNWDCNLEGYLMRELEAFLNGTISDDIVVVVQADRCAKDSPEAQGYTGRSFADTIEGWSGTKRLLFDKNGVTELEDLGETSTGDPKELAKFISWAYKNYPAEKTALVMQDHGNGWMCWGHDLDSKNDVLTVLEIGQALETGRRDAGMGRFDCILWECCLMSALEPARVLQPHCKYFAGSEEITYVGTPHWTDIITDLSADPSMEPLDFAKVFVNGWRGYFDNVKNDTLNDMGRRFPLHVVDSDRLLDVVTATDALCDGIIKVMKSGRPGWLKVASALNKAEEHGKQPGGSMHARDLHGFVKNLKGLGIDAEVDALLKAIETAVVHNVKAQLHPESMGLTVCFPSTKALYDAQVLRPFPTYKQTPASPKWCAMLDAYYKIQVEDSTPPNIRDLATTSKTFKIGQQVKFTTSVDADDIRESHFFLAVPQGKNFIIRGRYPTDISKGECEFDGTWLAFGYRSGLMLWACILSYDEIKDRNYVVGIPVKYTPPGAKEERDISLFFSVAFDKDWKFTTGKFLYAYEFSEQGPAPVTIRTGGKLRGSYQVITEDGKIVRWPSREELILGKTSLEITEINLPAGEYVAGYEVEDLAGNMARDYIKINLTK